MNMCYEYIHILCNTYPLTLLMKNVYTYKLFLSDGFLPKSSIQWQQGYKAIDFPPVWVEQITWAHGTQVHMFMFRWADEKGQRQRTEGRGQRTEDGDRQTYINVRYKCQMYMSDVRCKCQIQISDTNIRCKRLLVSGDCSKCNVRF